MLSSVKQPPSLREMAFEAIKRAIMDNTLEPGVVCTESELAAQLGMSKTPVHEALLDLSSRGFVTMLPRKGVQIKVLTVEDIHHLYEFRLIIETAILQRVAPNIRPDQIRRIEEMHFKCERATKEDDRLGYIREDRKLHGFLSSLSKNPYAVMALENIRDLIDWMGLKAMTCQGRLPEVDREHEAIIGMLETRDPSGAAQAMARHINMTEQNVLNWRETQKKNGISLPSALSGS